MKHETYQALCNRLTPSYVDKRLHKEKVHTSLEFRGGFRVHWENSDILYDILFRILRATKTIKIGLRNGVKYVIENNEVSLANLPEILDGLTILQLTDLHIDGMYDHGRRLQELIKTLTYDICVITGDFRFLTYGPVEESLLHTKHLLKALPSNKPLLGILGNHDALEMVPELERMGMRMLVNESVTINVRGVDIGFAGVDDQYVYHMADVKKALEGIDDRPVKIMLAHSPDCIPAASKGGAHLYLCGHTHGGQICLPGGMAIIKNSNFSGAYIKGPWMWDQMHGYTSRGTGASGMPVRFFCPPEVTLHTLRTRPA